MDTEFAAIREKERLKRLEEQIEDMILSARLDYKRLVKELDYECSSSPETMAVVKILLGIRVKQPGNRVLQKLLNHYAIERDGMVVLKP